MSTLIKSSAAAAAIMCAAAHADITDTAPADAFVVINIPDVAEFKSGFQDSPLNDLWQHPEIQAFVTAFVEEAEDEMTGDANLDWWSELEYFDGDEITTRSLVLEHLFPNDSLGLAFWVTETDSGQVSESFLYADYGDRADDMQGLLEQALDKGLEDELITYEEEEYGAATIFSVVFADDDENDEFGDNTIDNIPLGVEQLRRELHITRLGDVFLIGSSLETVELAIDASDGDADTLADSELHQDFLARHPDDLIAYVYARPDLLFASPEDPDLAGTDPSGFLFEQLGLTSVQSAGVSVALGNDGALINTRMTATMTEKTGLAALFDLERDGYQPPSFAGADTAQIYSFLFDFKGVIPLAREVIQGAPEAMRPMMEMQLTQAEGMFGQLIQVLGPNVHVVQRFRQPFELDSQEPLFAIELGDELIASNLATVWGGRMGITSRQFEGAQIFEGDDIPTALGIGAGYAFFGSVAMVENALRRASEPGDSDLANEPRFIDAADHIGGTGNFIGYYNTKLNFDYMHWMMSNIDDITRTMYEEWGFEDDELEEMLAAEREQRADFFDSLPSADVVNDVIGDQVWEIRSTDDGFVVDSVLLPAID